MLRVLLITLALGASALARAEGQSLKSENAGGQTLDQLPRAPGAPGSIDAALGMDPAALKSAQGVQLTAEQAAVLQAQMAELKKAIEEQNKAKDSLMKQLEENP